EKVRFRLANGGGTLWLTASGIALDVLRPKEGAASVKSERPNPRSAQLRATSADFERLVVSEDFVAANPSPEFEPRGLHPGIYNYLIGNDPGKWRSHVKAYGEVLYRNVWDGVDLRLYLNWVGPRTGVHLGARRRSQPNPDNVQRNQRSQGERPEFR
ncbi:MAG: hypothetical protein WBM24_19905, partial [Candidatus Sulfotelmatobacter sp.]